MQFLSTTALCTLFANLAAANFMIYTSSSITGELDGGQVSASGFFMFDGPPSCDDVCNHAIFIANMDDVSGGRSGARCEGCATGGPITEFEFHDQNTGTHWTIYQNSGYQITPADGGPLLGSCRPDSGDDFVNCSCGLGNAEDGQRLFICDSSLTPSSMGVAA